MYMVFAWNEKVQEYLTYFGALTYEECEEWCKLQRFVGDKRTFIIREVA